MAIADKLTTLNGIKSDIKAAIIAKGGTATDDFTTYATAISNLPSGGGSDDLKNLIERDITNINIPAGTTTIGSHAFHNCSGLTNITIPNSVTTIGDYAFFECRGLTSVTIPDSVIDIGPFAFGNCIGLTSITFLATRPPGIFPDTFQNVPSTCPIYVPAESVIEYQEEWSDPDREDYIQAIPEVTDIYFDEYQGFSDNTDFGDFDGYDTSETIILPFNDPSGTGTSSVSEMIKADSIVINNLGFDITADCTFTYSGDWQYSEQMCDDGEGNETPCKQGLWNEIGVDDDHTPYTGELIASYTTSDNRTLTSSLNFSWTQTSNGQDPGE